MTKLLKTKKRVLAGVLIGFILVALFVGYLIKSPELSVGMQSQSNAEKASELEFIQSKYVTMQYPAELSEVLIHEVDTFNGQYTDSFYMKHEDKDIPLFRFDFGPEIAGDWIGLLETKDGDVIITSVVFALDEAEFPDLSEADMEVYSSCMSAYSTILKGIVENPDFVVERPVEIGKNTEVKTTYWTFTLPNKMSVEEIVSENDYTAVFYGDVSGDHMPLYCVCVGDSKAETELGSYEIDGIRKPVSVGSYDLFEIDAWSEDDYEAAYRMMDTINHVIETIMSSKQFSIEAE